MRCKKNIPLIIVAFVGSLILTLYMVAYADTILRGIPLKSYKFTYVLNVILKSKLATKLYGYMVLLISLGFAFLFITDTKSYRSEQMKITDTISTPVKAGQGQYGTAKWLPEKSFDEVFCSLEFDCSELSEWEDMKLKDIEDELKRIDKLGL